MSKMGSAGTARNHQDMNSHAFNISRLDSTRSIKGHMPSTLEMACGSSSRRRLNQVVEPYSGSAQ